MNIDKIITLTTRIAFVAILILLYWIFIFICLSVFEFKVFRENITEIFYFSIIAILALLGSSMSVNVMLNLTKIANVLQHRGETAQTPSKMNLRNILLFTLSFPLLFTILYVGDGYTKKMKEQLLIKTAQQLVNEHSELLKQFAPYKFTESYLTQIQAALTVLTKIDENFSMVNLLIQDELNGEQVFLRFYPYSAVKETTKKDYLYPCSKDERQYLHNVFTKKLTVHRFSASDGFYELYYPIEIASQVFVLYFTDR